MTKQRKRLEPDDRTGQILAAAIKLATRKGFHALTRDAIATEADVSSGLVSKYFGKMDKVRDAIMREAVTREILPIVAAGILSRNRVAMRAPEPLRKRAVESLTG